VSSIRQPELIIHRTKDRNAPHGAGREWSWLLPEGRLLTVPGAAHMSWIDAPQVVLRAGDEFQKGSWPHGAEKVATPPTP
jgi:pimeloyl-ACP methyl ester carboxylesterase